MRRINPKNTRKIMIKSNTFLIFALGFSLPAIFSIVWFFTTSERESLNYIFGILFPLLDIIMWIIAIRTSIKNAKIFSAYKDGVEYQATIIHKPILHKTDNNIEKYAIQYKWLDENNVEHTFTSEPMYNIEEAHKLYKRKIITINYKDNIAVIMTNPNNPEEQTTTLGHKLKHHILLQKRLTCKYCGKEISKLDKQCPHCKAQLF